MGESKKLSILLVEDDTNMGFLLQEYLENKKFDVKLYRDGESGLRGFRGGNFDICILDVMMPKMDGFALANEIKKINSLVPIIFLTAKSMKEDKMRGFKLGVDDYITKPFDEDELLWRINAIMSRVGKQHITEFKEKYEIGKYTFDHRNQFLWYAGEHRRLTSKENEVLKLLCASKNEVTRREDILNKVWGDNNYFNGRSLDVFVAKLRKYLNQDPAIKIENIPRVGYILGD